MRALVFIGLTLSIWGQADMDTLKTELSSVEKNLQRLQKHLSSIQGKSSQISNEILEIELEKAIIEQQREQAETQLQISQKETERIQKEIDQLNQQKSQKEAVLAGLLRKMYVQGKSQAIFLMLKQNNFEDWLTALHYNQHLAKKNHKTISSYRETTQRLATVQESLGLITQQAQIQKQAMEQKEAELKELLTKRTRAWNKVKREQKNQTQLLRDLENERDELQDMMTKLVDGTADPSDLILPIRRFKGGLNWPVRGRVIQGFGVYSDPEFKTKRMQNGIDIEVQKGDEVRSIYDGKVIFADWFKSYGNLVIIDHGHQITSFYAHNDRLLVEKGDRVARNQTIAHAGDTGSLKGSFLHFEIRQNGKPVNPKQWIKKPSS